MTQKLVIYLFIIIPEHSTQPQRHSTWQKITYMIEIIKTKDNKRVTLVGRLLNLAPLKNFSFLTSEL